jgi:hypothetical protein
MRPVLIKQRSALKGKINTRFPRRRGGKVNIWRANLGESSITPGKTTGA